MYLATQPIKVGINFRQGVIFIIFPVIFIIFFSSCMKDTTGYAFPDNSNQIVTFASISPDSGVVVYLSRSFIEH